MFVTKGIFHFLHADWLHQKRCATSSDWAEFYREREHQINEHIKDLMRAAGGHLPEDEENDQATIKPVP